MYGARRTSELSTLMLDVAGRRAAAEECEPRGGEIYRARRVTA
jgi:hypothetical protein